MYTSITHVTSLRDTCSYIPKRNIDTLLVTKITTVTHNKHGTVHTIIIMRHIDDVTWQGFPHKGMGKCGYLNGTVTLLLWNQSQGFII